MATNARAFSGTRRPDEALQSPARRNGYAKLAAAILARAAKDAKRGDIDATFWLLTEQAEILSNGIGLSITHVQKWARAKFD